MFGSLMNRPKTKADVIMAIAAALVGVWKASDTVKEYKAQQAETEEKKS